MLNATREARKTLGGIIPLVGWEEFYDTVRAGSDPSTYAIVVSTTPLTGGATFTQTAVDRFASTTVDPDGILGPLLIGRVAGLVWADQAGTLFLEESDTGSSWSTVGSSVSVSASTTTELPWSKITKRFFRFRFVNGAAPQTVFRLYQRVGGVGRTDVELTGRIVTEADAAPLPSVLMDFKGKVSGAKAEVAHTFMSTSNAAIQTPSGTFGEVNQANYTNAVSQDGVVAGASSSTVLNNITQHLFSFDLLNGLKRAGKIPQDWVVADLVANVKSITVTWVGYGVGSNGGVSTNGAQFKGWNAGTASWEVFGSNTSSSPATSSFSFTNMARLDNGLLHLLAHSTHPSDGTIASSVFTDYIYVEVVLATEALIVTPLSEGRVGRLAPQTAMQTGGQFNSTPPTLTDKQFGATQMDPRGSTLVGIRSSGGTEPALNSSIGGGSDGLAALNALAVGAVMLAHNGANSDRWRNNTEGTLLASAARTALTNSPNQTNYNARGVVLILDVTANPGGAETLTVGLFPVSGTGKKYNSVATQVTLAAQNRTYFLFVYPGAGTVEGASNKAVSAPLPRTWHGQVSPSGAGSWTYSLEFCYIL